MLELLRRMAWFSVIASMLAYATYIVAGSFAEAQAAKELTVIRDELSPGVHRLSGMIMVPSSCDQISLRSEPLSTTTYALRFRVWQDPSLQCPKDEVPRAFHAVVYGPATGVQFIATVDERSIPIRVEPFVSRDEKF